MAQGHRRMHINRKMDELIETSDFRIVQLDMAYAKGLRPMSFIYSGRAQRNTSGS